MCSRLGDVCDPLGIFLFIFTWTVFRSWSSGQVLKRTLGQNRLRCHQDQPNHFVQLPNPPVIPPAAKKLQSFSMPTEFPSSRVHTRKISAQSSQLNLRSSELQLVSTEQAQSWLSLYSLSCRAQDFCDHWIRHFFIGMSSWSQKLHFPTFRDLSIYVDGNLLALFQLEASKKI